MATPTKSTARSRSGRGASTGASSARGATAATKKLPAAKAPVPVDEGPGVLASAWMGLAHLTGGAFRLFGSESLDKSERRDGVPFLLVLLAVAGAVVEWLNPTSPLAVGFDAYTFGGLVGRVAYALPVIMVLFAGWLFRHPASVHDNTRIGIGLGLMIVSISALCHIYGGQPQAVDGMRALATGGGVLGWLVASWLVALATEWVAVPVVVVLLALSLLIMTKTPPNRIGHRLGDLYRWLFGETTADASAGADGLAEVDGDAPDTLPWWRRNKSGREEDPAYDTPVVTQSAAGEGEGRGRASRRRGSAGPTFVDHGASLGADEPSAPSAPSPDAPTDVYQADLLHDLDAAEDAVRSFGIDVPLHDPEPAPTTSAAALADG